LHKKGRGIHSCALFLFAFDSWKLQLHSNNQSGANISIAALKCLEEVRFLVQCLFSGK